MSGERRASVLCNPDDFHAGSGIEMCIRDRAVATTMYLCSAAAGGYSVRQVRALNEPKKVPVMGVMGAFVFATQMINFTIPGRCV